VRSPERSNGHSETKQGQDVRRGCVRVRDPNRDRYRYRYRSFDHERFRDLLVMRIAIRTTTTTTTTTTKIIRRKSAVSILFEHARLKCERHGDFTGRVVTSEMITLSIALTMDSCKQDDANNSRLRSRIYISERDALTRIFPSNPTSLRASKRSISFALAVSDRASSTKTIWIPKSATGHACSYQRRGQEKGEWLAREQDRKRERQGERKRSLLLDGTSRMEFLAGAHSLGASGSSVGRRPLRRMQPHRYRKLSLWEKAERVVDSTQPPENRRTNRFRSCLPDRSVVLSFLPCIIRVTRSDLCPFLETKRKCTGKCTAYTRTRRSRFLSHAIPLSIREISGATEKKIGLRSV